MGDTREPPQRKTGPLKAAASDGAQPPSRRAVVFRIGAVVLGVLGVLAVASAGIAMVLVGLVAFTCSK